MSPQEYIRTIASHYPDSDSIHRILEYASVDIINVDIEGKPLNTWFMALKEVVNQNRLPDFIQAISAEYPALQINEAEQQELSKFLAKKVNAPGENQDDFRKYSSLFLKLSVPVILIVGYIIFNSGRKVRLSDNNSPVVVEQDSATNIPQVVVEKIFTSADSFEFVTIRYKDKSFDFPAHKSILQLKQYILASKEGLRDFDAGKSQLTYLGKMLAENLRISNLYWGGNENVDLKIARDSTISTPHVDIFLQNRSLHDILIFIEDQAGYITELHNDRTRLWIPQFLGDHNLEIYFKDSLAVLPLHIEYSTSNISITAEEFRKSAKAIERVIIK